MIQPSSPSYLVARHDDTVYVRALGLANMRNAPLLDAFLRKAIEEGVKTACVDLAECTGMDSTFMGTLVCFGQEFIDVQGRLLIVRPSESNRRLLDMLGVSVVVTVVDAVAAPGLDFVEIAAAHNAGTVERMELVRRAHQGLVGLSESNRSKFAAFLTALEADLKRLGTPRDGAQKPSP